MTARQAPGSLRVLYVLRYYPTLTETFVYREASALMARGVFVAAVAMGSRQDGTLQDERPGWAVRYPPSGLGAAALIPAMRRLASRDGRATWRAVRRASTRKHAARALWLADELAGTDRVHAHFAGEAAEWGLAAARLAGVPFSVTVHASDLWRPRPALDDVLRAARPVIAVSEDARAEIRRRTGRDARVVRCGVDPRGPIAEPGAAGPLRVVSVARNVPKKGLDRLVEAVERAPYAVSLRLVSDGFAATGRVAPGALPPSAVRATLAAAHVFALPCRVAPDGDRDGIPVAILEAMAAGLPVIATAVGGIPEVIDDTVGWLLDPTDPSALDRALADAAADPAGRARRGAAARARVATLTVDAQADALLAAWENA